MSKLEADRCKKIEVWWLLKNIHKTGGYKSTNISWGEKGNINIVVNLVEPNNYIEFNYSIIRNGSDEKQSFNYKTQIVFTFCHYGGKRYWFICPLTTDGIYCGKRVGVLYQAYNYFGCRHCSKLTYSSRKKNKNCRFSYFSEIFDIEDELEKIESKRHNYSYRGKPTKAGKKIQKLYSRKMIAFADFEFQEKKLKGRLSMKKML